MDAVGINSSITDFENVFESLDVKVEELNGAMDNVYSASIDGDEVSNLLQEMQSANGMKIDGQM